MKELALALLLLLPNLVHAELLQGLPLLQRFTSRDHHASATSVAVLQAPDGLLFVGNERGLLRFDGSHWDRLDLPGRISVRALGLGADGHVYVGGYDRFGRAEVDTTGALKFVDLTSELKATPDSPAVGQIWVICSTAEGMYVYSDTVLAFRGNDGKRANWPINADVRGPFCTKSGVFARVQGLGLAKLETAGFAAVSGGEPFADSALYHVFDTDGGILAVGELGFYRMDGEGLQLLPNTDGHRFAEYPPYAGVKLKDGSFAFGTYSGELLHYSSELRLLTAHSISPNTIFELSLDAEGGLWAATEGDLLRLRFPSAWSVYPAELGLIGQAYDTAHYKGDLYIATSVGVLRARPNDGTGQLQPAVTTTLEASALEVDPAGLLIADRVGVMVMSDPALAPTPLIQSDAPSTLLRSRKFPQRVYAPATGALDILETRDGRWTQQGSIPLGELSISGIEESVDGFLWLGDSRGGPLRLQIDADGDVLQRQVFGVAEGLQVNPDFGSFVVGLDEQIYVVSGERVQHFINGRFEQVSMQPFSLLADPSEMSISETAVGAFAYSNNRLLHRPAGSNEWLPMLSGSALAGGYASLRLDEDGLVRLGSWDGLLQYDPNQPEPALPALAVRMRSISLRVGDGENVSQPLAANDAAASFPAGSMVQFDFNLPTTEPAAQFRLRILGMFDEFSAWGPVVSPALSLRVPGPGKYQLEVEGRTPSGRVAKSLLYRFEVLPQWWQQPLAQAGAALLAFLALIGVAMLGLRWRDRRYVLINQALEMRIAERTAELETANAKLAELATEDELTGIANRRALEQALKREWDRCRELQQPLAVVMIDVDHFKRFNDRYGHLAGDQHLVQVAAVLRRHARPVRELLARYGGEEFVMVLPGVTCAAAAERAEAIRLDVEQTLIHTTISLGVAAEVPQETGSGPNAILQRADAALYRAKNSGRNRVGVDA